MNSLQKHARWAAIVCMFVTVVLSLMPVDPMAGAGVDDKWGHCLAYAGTAFSGHIGWRGRHRPYQLVAALAAVGAIIEALQGLVGRHPELMDVGADTLGALFGVGIAVMTATIWRLLARLSS